VNKSTSNEIASLKSEAVEAAIFRAVDTLNETLAKTQQIAKSRDTVLVDSQASVDSLAIVNLIVFIEDEIAGSFGHKLDLSGADPFAEEDLKTLGSLIDALCGKLHLHRA
jgi:acyl carrier protein